MLKNRQQIKKNDVSRQQLYLKKVNIHESNTVEGQLPKMHMLGKNKPEKASEIQREDAMMLLQDAQTMYKTDHKTVSKDNQESENNFTTVQQSNIEELSILQNEEVKVAVNSQGIAVVVHKHLTPLPVPSSRKTSRQSDMLLKEYQVEKLSMKKQVNFLRSAKVMQALNKKSSKKAKPAQEKKSKDDKPSLEYDQKDVNLQLSTLKSQM